MSRRKFSITPQVIDEICNTIGIYPAETGALLGSSDGNTIDFIHFDYTASPTGSTYSPNIASLNQVKNEWNDEGVVVAGFAHSHPGRHSSPSREDIQYGKRIMRALGMENFFMPIVNVNDLPDGKIKVFPYFLNKRGRLRRQPMILAESQHQVADGIHSAPTPEDIFTRVKNLYPLDVLSHKTGVCIGCGGTRGFTEELARSGVGNFILIDGDLASASNIATQQVYVSEIGRYKVDALRDRILDINPEANVTAIPQFLDDTMTDKDFEGIVGDMLIKSPKDVLIIGCTDSFHAQARSAALAMKYGTPYLAAQLYKGGMAAEIYHSYPGVTNSGCPRCAMRSRYKAYADGYKNDVTSDGAPIFATSRVNSLKGQIALMLMLYHEDENCVYNTMLDQVADRNFLMICMSPRADKELGIDIFQEMLAPDTDLNFFDETVWIPQEPNAEQPCPLCGGTGDLLALKDKIRDTRTDW